MGQEYYNNENYAYDGNSYPQNNGTYQQGNDMYMQENNIYQQADEYNNQNGQYVNNLYADNQVYADNPYVQQPYPDNSYQNQQQPYNQPYNDQMTGQAGYEIPYPQQDMYQQPVQQIPQQQVMDELYQQPQQKPPEPHQLTNAEWLQQNGPYSFRSDKEYNHVIKELRQWNKDYHTSRVLNGFIFSYLAGVILYVFLYWHYNGGIVPKVGWNDTTAFCFCGLFILTFTIIHGIIAHKKHIDVYGAGTIIEKAYPETRKDKYIFWIKAGQETISVPVKKDRFKIYSQGERIILFVINDRKQELRFIHMLNKKQRKRAEKRYQERMADQQYN